MLRCDVLSQRFRMEPTITEEALHHHWPGVVEDDELLRVTVEEALGRGGVWFGGTVVKYHGEISW